MKTVLLAMLLISSAFADNRPFPGPINRPIPNPIPAPVPPTIASPTSPETAQPMWCRTPLSFTPGLTLHVYYTRSSVAAGYNGENLKPGTCGWVDRPMNSSDPIDLILTAMPDQPANTDALQTIWVGEINAKGSIAAAALVQNDIYIVFPAYVYKNVFMRVKDSQFTVKPRNAQ